MKKKKNIFGWTITNTINWIKETGHQLLMVTKYKFFNGPTRRLKAYKCVLYQKGRDKRANRWNAKNT